MRGKSYPRSNPIEIRQDVDSNIPASPTRVPQLDGIRGFAILLVILYHYVAVSVPADASKGFLFLRQVFSNAWSGVDLFFVLSGFLIAGILIDNRASINYFQVFYTRRISRIFPLYYFFLLLFILFQIIATQQSIFSKNLFVNSIPIIPYFVYLQNLAMATHGTFGNEFLAVTWSLAIEEHYYLLLPLIVRWSSPSKLSLNLIFLICLTLVLRATLGTGKFYAFVFTPWRLDGLFLGALLAILFRSSMVSNMLKSYLGLVKILFVAMLLYFVYSSMTEPLGSLDHLFIFALLYALLILLSVAENTGIARFFRWSPLINIGRISYGVYLFHQLVNGVVHDLLFKRPPSFHSLPTILATFFAFLVTLLVALGTYHLFEKQFIALGHRFSYSREDVVFKPIEIASR